MKIDFLSIVKTPYRMRVLLYIILNVPNERDYLLDKNVTQ